MYIPSILQTQPPTKVVLPIQWFQSIDLVQSFNWGISHTKTHKVFHCDDINQDPNFRLPIRQEFVGDIASCYYAKILCAFSTIEEAEKYLEKRRTLLKAAVYNENLTRYDWHAPEPSEQTCNQTVHVKLEQEVGRLQTEITQLQNQMGIHDLDRSEIRELQETLMDVDDEIEFAIVMPKPISYKTENEDERSEQSLLHYSDSNDSQNIADDTCAQSPGNAVHDSARNSISPNDMFVADPVAGSIHMITDAKGDKYFPHADAHLCNAIYGLLNYYNVQQESQHNGELFDIKYVNLLLKGIFGYVKLVDMETDTIDYSHPKMDLVKCLFKVRVDGNENRMVFFKQHVVTCIEDVKNQILLQQFKRKA